MIKILTKVYEKPLLMESAVENEEHDLMRVPGDSGYSKSKPRKQEMFQG